MKERWAVLHVEKTKGQIAYEADVRRKPVYQDGTTRKHWTELSDIARWSWERLT